MRFGDAHCMFCDQTYHTSISSMTTVLVSFSARLLRQLTFELPTRDENTNLFVSVWAAYETCASLTLCLV